MTEYPDKFSTRVEQIHCRMHFLGFHHVEIFTKCKITHDVEAVQVKLFRNVDWSSFLDLNLSQQLICVVNYSRLVVSERYYVSMILFTMGSSGVQTFRRESLIPRLASTRMIRTVSCRVK